ncbi:hypothetical protein AX16_006548 [Volvariella volvacea WC 439]|nr:hypothetical protein AX16_006548 [Volvariella volvacea WC 439]
MPAPCIEAQIADIDATISSLEAQLLDLRKRRNRLMPLSKLPPELINDILSHLVDLNVSESEKAISVSMSKENSLRIFRWLPVTHFCAQWRQLALTHSSLWTHIWTTNLTGFKTFMERSKDQLLRIDTWSCSPRGSEHDEMLQLIASNMHRIRSLRLRLSSTDDKVLLLRNIPAPELETLTISNPLYSTVLAPPIPLDPDIMPKLRRLEVDSCSGDEWNCLLPFDLPSVTTVVLKDLTFKDHVAVLSRCTNARHLTIVDGFLDEEQPTPIELPQLQYLKFSHSPWALFNCLSLPSVSQVDIDTTTTSNGSDDADTATSALTKLLDSFKHPAHSRAELDHLSLSFEVNKLSVIARGAMDEQLITFSSDNIWQLVLDASNYTEWFDVMLQISHTTGIGLRTIDVKGTLGAQSLFYAFQEHSPVSTIQIYNDEAFIDFLTLTSMNTIECIVHALESPPTKPFCDCEGCHELRVSSYPGLKTLVLDAVEGGWVPIKDAEWLDLFLDWLGERGRRGIGLEELTLRSIRGKVGQEDLERLRRVVTRVVLEEHDEPLKDLEGQTAE